MAVIKDVVAGTKFPATIGLTDDQIAKGVALSAGNFIQGHPKYFATLAELQACPPGWCLPGNEGYVYADPLATNNGKYAVALDLVTWKKQYSSFGEDANKQLQFNGVSYATKQDAIAANDGTLQGYRIALTQLDNQAQLAFVGHKVSFNSITLIKGATSWTARLYKIDASGAIVPGFPQTTIAGINADLNAMTAAELNAGYYIGLSFPFVAGYDLGAAILIINKL